MIRLSVEGLFLSTFANSCFSVLWLELEILIILFFLAGNIRHEMKKL